ncbi:MAG: glycosyltransferase family 39 protein [Chloroflexi bacterium]|nr:glycosyltransferase family 39 protein [Chloroflexota bacterium]
MIAERVLPGEEPVIQPPGKTFRWEIGAVFALLLVSAALRFYRLDTVPPGMISDVATNGLDIRDVFAGHLQVFFPANNGREAFFIYFQALLVAGAGVNTFVFSYSALAMGLLTVALTYRLLRELFGPPTAWIAAFLLSSAFWLVALSRIGLRTVSYPPFLLASVYLLWQLLRTGRRRYAVLGGIALGAALYTYIAARLLPLLLLLMCLAIWPEARRRWRELALAVVVALAVFAPEGVYFAQHSQMLVQRTEDVAVFNPEPQVEGAHDTPLQSVLATAGMFFVQGDANRRYNVPGRPIFDPLLAVCFAVGLAGSLWLARRDARHRWLLLWLVVASLPSALSHESPDMFRAFAVAPVAFAFAGLGATWLPTIFRRIGLMKAVLAGLAAWSVVWTCFLYFGQWAGDPRTYAAYAGGVTKLASFIAQQPEQALVFAYHDRWPVELLTPRTLGAQWNALDTVAVPIPAAPNGDVLYTVQPSSALRQPVSLLPGAVALPTPTDPQGAPEFLAFRWPQGAVQQLLAGQKPLAADMAPDLRLSGYTLEPTNAGVSVSLLWQPLAMSGPYDLYVHLLDPTGKQIAQSDVLVRAPDEGSLDGYLLLTRHALAAPPGEYTAEIGAAHRSSDHPERVVGGPIGQPARLSLTFGR